MSMAASLDNDWVPRQTIAVLGGSTSYSEEQLVFAYRVGLEIANRGRVLLTGATSGIPYAAALGAHKAGGLVVGISPAAAAPEHIDRYGKPERQADVLIYTGMGTEGRSPVLVRSARAAIFIGGEFGTLGEFCSAWTCGSNVLGVLEAGGISDVIRSLVSRVSTSCGSALVYGSDPAALVERICAMLDQLPNDRLPVDTNDEVMRILTRALEP